MQSTPKSERRLVKCTPRTLVFPYASPGVSGCTTSVRLENITPSMVTYRIKSTSQKRYVVRPFLGILQAGQAVEISVMCNYDEVRNEGIDLATVTDAFQVRAIEVDGNGLKSGEELQQIWANVTEEELNKTILKCKFVPPEMVKTEVTTPGSVRGGGTGLAVTPGQGGPDLETAKRSFKNEMAITNLKKELKAMRDEKEMLEARLREKEELVLSLKQQVDKLNAFQAGGSSYRSSAGIRSVIWFAVLYFLVLVLCFFVCYKALGYDPLKTISPELSVAKWESWLFGKKL